MYDQQVRLYGRERKAAEETVRICKDRGVLREYLEAHEKEVVNSMIMLFEQEEAVKIYGNRRAAEARIDGWNEGKVSAFADMVAKGMITVETAANELDMTVEQFREAVEALKVTA